MRCLLLFLLAAWLPFCARSQSANPAVWCPPGATWVYGYSIVYPTVSGILTLRYARDTTVLGQRAQLITSVRSFSSGFNAQPPFSNHLRETSLVTRAVGDRVEILHNNVFRTLYDFAALPGASWITPAIHCLPTTVVQVVVDSVGNQLIGGRTFRWLRVHLNSVAGIRIPDQWYGRIYEQVGSAGAYMLPGAAQTCSNFEPVRMGPLRTYSATTQPPLRYNYLASALVLGRTEARAEAAGFAAYPNPTAGLGLLAVQLPPGLPADARLLLLDITGRPVRQQPARAGQRLDVRGLAGGTYTLVLREAGRPDLMRRLVLE